MPAGVPVPLYERPPPQPTHIMTESATRPKLSKIRRRLAARSAKSAAARTAASQEAGSSGEWENGKLIFGPGGMIVRAAVVTVTTACTGSVPFGVTEAGETEHVACASEDGIWQLNETWALNPEVGVTVTAYCTGVPAKAVAEGVELESEKSEPPPESAMA